MILLWPEETGSTRRRVAHRRLAPSAAWSRRHPPCGPFCAASGGAMYRQLDRVSTGPPGRLRTRRRAVDHRPPPPSARPTVWSGRGAPPPATRPAGLSPLPAGDVLMARLACARAAPTPLGAPPTSCARRWDGCARPGARGQLTVRADSGFYAHAWPRFSITVRQRQSLPSDPGGGLDAHTLLDGRRRRRRRAPFPEYHRRRAGALIVRRVHIHARFPTGPLPPTAIQQFRLHHRLR